MHKIIKKNLKYSFYRYLKSALEYQSSYESNFLAAKFLHIVTKSGIIFFLSLSSQNRFFFTDKSSCMSIQFVGKLWITFIWLLILQINECKRTWCLCIDRSRDWGGNAQSNGTVNPLLWMCPPKQSYTTQLL